MAVKTRPRAEQKQMRMDRARIVELLENVGIDIEIVHLMIDGAFSRYCDDDMLFFRECFNEAFARLNRELEQARSIY